MGLLDQALRQCAARLLNRLPKGTEQQKKRQDRGIQVERAQGLVTGLHRNENWFLTGNLVQI